MPPKTHYAKSGEVNIAYQVVGDGPMDLVFVPGFISHLDLQWADPRGVRELKGVPGEWSLFAVDKVETPASSRLVPDSRERRFSFADS